MYLVLEPADTGTAQRELATHMREEVIQGTLNNGKQEKTNKKSIRVHDSDAIKNCSFFCQHSVSYILLW